MRGTIATSGMSSRRYSRRGLLARLLTVVAAAPVFGCGDNAREASGTTTPAPAASQTPPPATATAPATSTTTPTPPTLREKIGRMVMTGFAGLTAEPESVIGKEIASGTAGGVILFDRDTVDGSRQNIASPSQLRALTAGLLRLNPRLLIGVDEEGGAVARLGPAKGFSDTVSAASLGEKDDPVASYDGGAAIAGMLRAAGINTNFAPVVDLNVNPGNPIIGQLDRSFSADPDVVIRNAEAFIRAHRDSGIRTVLKHFPGHGSSVTDSHLGFTDVTKTWSAVELQPFARIIADGLADMVLVAHLFNARLDADHPASLSHATITGILREQLGFDGVVVTDSMGMKAISDRYTFEAAVQLAIEAGVDILLYAAGGDDGLVAKRVVDHIESLVHSGSVSEARIDESHRRIVALLGG